MYIKSLFYKLKANPKKVFLLDASGALISLVSFLCILNPFIEYFGMPSNVLYKLSAIAVFLFIYSFSCSKLIKSNWRPF